jgi:hypothetical protein
MGEDVCDNSFQARVRAVRRSAARDEATARLVQLSAADFAPAVGQVFRLACEGEEFELLLDEVKERNPLPGVPGRASFALFFRGPADRLLLQGSHPFVNATLGELAFFVVPLGPDSRGTMSYQALFN